MCLHLAGRIACISSWFTNVLGYHTTGTNHNIITDANRHDGGIRTDAHTIADGGFFPLGLIPPSRATNSEWVIDEHRTVTDEAILSNGHKFANKGVALDTCAGANGDSSLDLNKRSDKHAITQFATIDVDRFNQCYTLTEVNFDDAVLVDSGLAHDEGVANLSLEWVGSIMLKAPRGESVLMSGDGVEIEYRFFIPDSAILPPLGRGVKIIQCYLPKWKIQIENNHLCLEERVLVRDLSMDVIRELSALIETANITPRIRLMDDAAFVTVKGPQVDYARAEWEFEVMVETVRDLVTSFRFPHVMKTRFNVQEFGGLTWEIDFFEGDNHGLVMAELEVPSANHEFVRPEWLGQDVTGDERFGNGSLARDAWCDWKDDVEHLMASN